MTCASRNEGISPNMYRHLGRAARPLRLAGRFVMSVLRGFHANQGFLLAGALAYYTLLSIIPLFTLVLVILSHVVDENRLLSAASGYLSLAMPEESASSVLEPIKAFLDHRQLIGSVVFVAMLFFSSIAFTVLEQAMAVIFKGLHAKAGRRHFLVSVLLPYLYILSLGLGLLLTTLAGAVLQALGEERVLVLGHQWSLEGLNVALIYLLGVAGEILMLTLIYLVMPFGHPAFRHALVGGVVAGLLWEITRHALVWYIANISLVNIVYGSLGTIVIVLLSLELGSIILLLGAQVTAEYERAVQRRKQLRRVSQAA